MVIQNNDVFSFGSLTGTYEKLPLGTYRLKQDKKTDEYYLVKVDDFTIPSKIYGNQVHEERILNTFKHSERNLGCLFVGPRGSGKTISCKSICLKSQMPVIIIDAGFDDLELISFMANPELGPCVIFIDEFDKLYLDDRQVDETIMLQILDGAANYHHLFLLTANSITGLSSALINRPSRIFYRKIYSTVPQDVLNEILDNELKNIKWKNEMLEVLNKFITLTYDVVMSLIKEVNLYDESPLECAKLMNFSTDKLYVEVHQIFPEGKRFLRRTTISENECFEIDVYKSISTTDDYSWITYRWEDCKCIDDGVWEIQDGDVKLMLRRCSTINLLF